MLFKYHGRENSKLLKARVSPLGRICQVALSDVRTLLLELFEQWGMPLAIRTDDGEPWGAHAGCDSNYVPVARGLGHHAHT